MDYELVIYVIQYNLYKTVILDIDQYKHMKDLTRIKTGLTAKGIKVLEDEKGVFEYMKEIIDLKYAPENRRKVWKKIKGDNPRDTRYTRCLVVDLNGTEAGEEYLLDVDTRIIRPFSKEETQCEAPIFFEFKDPAVRGSSDRNYDGK